MSNFNLAEVGARWFRKSEEDYVYFGIYLPGIRYLDGYTVRVKIIHEDDAHLEGIEPWDCYLNWNSDSYYDLWNVEIKLPEVKSGNGNFGKPGKYWYRYQLLKNGEEIVKWFSDPFSFESGAGTFSAFTVGGNDTFDWEDDDFKVPFVNDMLVYELNVAEFHNNFEGVVRELPYLEGLGVNTIELMPITNIDEDYRWGYLPLNYFAPDERFGTPGDLKRLINECHKRGIAVILDSVYAHTSQEFPYNKVYSNSYVEVDNPMMGHFEGGDIQPETDFEEEFTRDFFVNVNKYWLDEYHCDGFRYDYVPGYYDSFMGVGFSKLVYETYNISKRYPRFKKNGYSGIIQCAEHLPAPQEILEKTYANTAWQNGLLSACQRLAGYMEARAELDHKFPHNDFTNSLVQFTHCLDLSFCDYPEHYNGNGDVIPNNAFQYIETHDHSRIITFVKLNQDENWWLKPYGSREFWYKLQPFVIALYTCQGIPMLWQGQEFVENYNLPPRKMDRVRMLRFMNWRYFYDEAGKGMVALYRRMAKLREQYPALRSRKSHYYHNQSNPEDGWVAYLRETPDSRQKILVFLNFDDHHKPKQISFNFPFKGLWKEVLNERAGDEVYAQNDWEQLELELPSNYGKIYILDA